MAKIRKDIQDKVDMHIKLHAEFKRMERELKELRGEIEPYMEEKGLDKIDGTDGGYIEYTDTNRANITSKYTSYDINGVVSLLDDQARKQCIVEVVDKDVLELLVKTGKAPNEVKTHKILKTTKTFRVNHC